jgi:hypothetical protein
MMDVKDQLFRLPPEPSNDRWYCCQQKCESLELYLFYMRLVEDPFYLARTADLSAFISDQC